MSIPTDPGIGSTLYMFKRGQVYVLNYTVMSAVYNFFPSVDEFSCRNILDFQYLRF